MCNQYLCIYTITTTTIRVGRGVNKIKYCPTKGVKGGSSKMYWTRTILVVIKG